jgi:hypothetical protein
VSVRVYIATTAEEARFILRHGWTAATAKFGPERLHASSAPITDSSRGFVVLWVDVPESVVRTRDAYGRVDIPEKALDLCGQPQVFACNIGTKGRQRLLETIQDLERTAIDDDDQQIVQEMRDVVEFLDDIGWGNVVQLQRMLEI